MFGRDIGKTGDRIQRGADLMAHIRQILGLHLIGKLRLCSIFVNPDSKRNYDDSVVQVNNWLPGKEDELVDISWPRFAARVHN